MLHDTVKWALKMEEKKKKKIHRVVTEWSKENQM